MLIVYHFRMETGEVSPVGAGTSSVWSYRPCTNMVELLKNSKSTENTTIYSLFHVDDEIIHSTRLTFEKQAAVLL